MTIVVRQTRIIGTNCVVFSAWEPTKLLDPHEGHSTITNQGGVWFGRVGTARLPTDIDAIPVGAKRSHRVRGWYLAEYGRAYRAIIEAYPELANRSDIRADMGEIEVRQ